MDMRKLLQTLLLLIVCFATAAPLEAITNDIRCGARIASRGDRKFDVLAKCGEPTFVTTRYEKRVKRDFYRDLSPPRDPRESEQYREPLFAEELVEIEEWVYNLGSLQFVRYLTFENGILVNIELGNYGY